MKSRNRPRSTNIVDQRNYFGTDAFDPDYSWEDRFNDFAKDSLRNPYADNPQKFKPAEKRTIEQILVETINAR